MKLLRFLKKKFFLNLFLAASGLSFGTQTSL